MERPQVEESFDPTREATGPNRQRRRIGGDRMSRIGWGGLALDLPTTFATRTGWVASPTDHHVGARGPAWSLGDHGRHSCSGPDGVTGLVVKEPAKQCTCRRVTVIGRPRGCFGMRCAITDLRLLLRRWKGPRTTHYQWLITGGFVTHLGSTIIERSRPSCAPVFAGSDKAMDFALNDLRSPHFASAD